MLHHHTLRALIAAVKNRSINKGKKELCVPLRLCGVKNDHEFEDYFTRSE